MIFKTIEEAKEHFYTYSEIPEGKYNPNKEWYTYHYDPKPEMGDWLLFQHIKGKTISRPIFALCCGHTVWDQALVLEYVEPWRTWFSNLYIGDPEDLDEDGDPNSADWFISYIYKECKQIQFWTENIRVLGFWKTKPKFRQLREAYKNIMSYA